MNLRDRLKSCKLRTKFVLPVSMLIVLSIITHLIARRVRRSHLGALDRSLGMVFGLLRGAILVCVAWLALAWTVPRDDYPTWLRLTGSPGPGRRRRVRNQGDQVL